MRVLLVNPATVQSRNKGEFGAFPNGLLYMAAVLEKAGHRVVVAGNGQEAIEQLEQRQFDLVLMDVQMPVMGGYEATETIRKDPQFKNLPILAMTANVFVEDRRACMAAGMNDFIAKPVDVDILFSTLAKWLPKRDSKGENTAP